MEERFRDQGPVRALRRAALAVLSIGGPAAPAFAQEPAPAPAPVDPNLERARELFQNGRDLYNEGHYEDAIAAWAESFRLSGRPELLFNISGAYERLAQYDRALEYLDRYRAFAPASERETLDRHIHALEERSADQRQSTPPIPALQPAPAPVTAPPPVEPEPSGRGGVPVFPVVLLGTGAVGIGVGTWAGLRAGAAESDLRDVCVDGDGGLLCPSEAQSTVERHGTSALVSAISLGVGGALGLTGGVLWAVHGAGDLVIAPGAGRSGAGVTVRGGF